MNVRRLTASCYRAAGLILKPLLTRTLYRPGKVATILRGPSKGLRYHIFPDFGLSHLYGGWEPEVMRLLATLVKPGMVCYDIGANHGWHALLMARCAGPNGKVFAFEPVPGLLASAKKNRDLNGFSSIELVPTAVASAKGRAEFSVGHQESAGHLLADGGDGTGLDDKGSKINVEVTTIDDFVSAGHPPPDLIKLDVEGAESAALSGARLTMADRRPRFLIELHTPEQDRLVGALLLESGYRAFRIDEPGLPPVRDMTKGYPDADGMRGHVLAVHHSQLAGDRPVL